MFFGGFAPWLGGIGFPIPGLTCPGPPGFVAPLGIPLAVPTGIPSPVPFPVAAGFPALSGAAFPRPLLLPVPSAPAVASVPFPFPAVASGFPIPFPGPPVLSPFGLPFGVGVPAPVGIPVCFP